VELKENNVDIFAGWTFPIFNEAYRETLKQKILDHFYFYEIGVETPGRFIFNLRTRLNEIMPYYNKMYETTLLEQRILDNYDVTETFTKESSNDINVNNNLTENITGAANNTKVFSDTAQGRISMEGIEGEYASQITKDSGDNTSDTTTSGTVVTTDEGSENWTRTMKGNIGVQTDSDAIIKYRQSLINVDLMIINELTDLFMQVW
jgi:hypothetical protein